MPVTVTQCEHLRRDSTQKRREFTALPELRAELCIPCVRRCAEQLDLFLSSTEAAQPEDTLKTSRCRAENTDALFTSRARARREAVLCEHLSGDAPAVMVTRVATCAHIELWLCNACSLQGVYQPYCLDCGV